MRTINGSYEGQFDCVRHIDNWTYRKDPLESKRTTPSPHVSALVEAVADASDDDSSN
jgi:hypothetical protein